MRLHWMVSPHPCRHVRTLQAQSTEDEIVMLSLLEDKQRFLEKALKNYILCLRTGVRGVNVAVNLVCKVWRLVCNLLLSQDEHDLRVFRLCALWFANCSNININTIVKVRNSFPFPPLIWESDLSLDSVFVLWTLNFGPSHRRVHLNLRAESFFLSCISWQPEWAPAHLLPISSNRRCNRCVCVHRIQTS